MPSRKLTLTKESLVELTSDDMRAVVGAQPTTANTKECPDYTYYCITGYRICGTRICV